MSDPQRRPQIVERARWFQLTEAASIGIEMAAAVGVGAFAGMYLERNVTHWAPWTTFIGLGIGIAAAVLAVLRTVRNFNAVLAKDDPPDADEAAADPHSSSAGGHKDEDSA